jgi:hypothetical protein
MKHRLGNGASTANAVLRTKLDTTTCLTLHPPTILTTLVVLKLTWLLSRLVLRLMLTSLLVLRTSKVLTPKKKKTQMS